MTREELLARNPRYACLTRCLEFTSYDDYASHMEAGHTIVIGKPIAIPPGETDDV